MTSKGISSASAVILGLAGLALMFGADVLLPAVIPEHPASGAWLGQLLAAAWVGIALFNWNARDSILGGIYGRPIVQLNVFVYAVGALGLLKAGHLGVPLLIMAGVMTAFGIVYLVAMFRGPFDPPQLD